MSTTGTFTMTSIFAWPGEDAISAGGSLPLAKSASGASHLALPGTRDKRKFE